MARHGNYGRAIRLRPISSSGRSPAPSGAPPPSGSPGSEPPAERKCANCGQSLAPGQEWCLACGTFAAPGALTARSPGWRSAALILGATAILVLAGRRGSLCRADPAEHAGPGDADGRAGAGGDGPRDTRGAHAPAAGHADDDPAAKALPVPTSKPPKIPLTAATPKALPTTPKTTRARRNRPPPLRPRAAETNSQQPAILLDTNAASTYKTPHLPEASFGDPSLAIDGETSTGWTAVVEPATAPNMAVGLLIDLKDTQRLSAAEVVTPTPGLTAAIYGSSAAAAPPAITSTEWTALSKAQVIKKRHARINLSHSSTGFRFVVLWISKAPASAVGTPGAGPREHQRTGTVRCQEVGAGPRTGRAGPRAKTRRAGLIG